MPIGELFLIKAPKMLNVLNKNEQTPLDNVMVSMEKYKNNNNLYKSCEALINLFKERGGKTAIELMQKSN